MGKQSQTKRPLVGAVQPLRGLKVSRFALAWLSAARSPIAITTFPDGKWLRTQREIGEYPMYSNE